MLQKIVVVLFRTKKNNQIHLLTCSPQTIYDDKQLKKQKEEKIETTRGKKTGNIIIIQLYHVTFVFIFIFMIVYTSLVA